MAFEIGRNLVEGLSSSFRNSKEGEQQEKQEECRKDEEDIRTTEVLQCKGKENGVQ